MAENKWVWGEMTPNKVESGEAGFRWSDDFNFSLVGGFKCIYIYIYLSIYLFIYLFIFSPLFGEDSQFD